MQSSASILGVIPVRWESTRFPGKPLAMLKGKPLIQRVWERVNQVSDISTWLIATDDQRIFRTVEEFGGKAVMTSSAHVSGTDRIAEVAQDRNEEIIINVQGDEPLLDPKTVEAMIDVLISDPKAQVSTAVYPIRTLEELEDANVVKVLLDLNRRALAFSRSLVPYVRDNNSRQSWIARGIHYRHLGIYAYRRDALLAFSKWSPGPLEQAEKLEQLRFLEHGIPIICAVVDHGSPDVNTPEDLRRVASLIS